VWCFFWTPYFFGPEPAQKSFLREPGVAWRRAGGKSGFANLQPLPTRLEHLIPNVGGAATPPFLLYHDHNLHNGRKPCVRRRRKRPHDTEVGITLTESHYSCKRPTEGAPPRNPVFGRESRARASITTFAVFLGERLLCLLPYTVWMSGDE